MICLERLRDWAWLVLRMPSFSRQHRLAHREFITCFGARLLLIMKHSPLLTICCGLHSAGQQIRTWRTHSGCRQACQSRKVVYGSDVLPRLRFQPFLASAAGTVSLQDAILARYDCPTDSFFETFRQTWSDTFGTSPPPPMSCTNSLSGTGWAFSAIKKLVKSGLVTCEHQASFRAAAAPHSGDWLHVIIVIIY